MQKATIRDFSWFKASSYGVLANFDVGDWASVLHGRLVISQAIKRTDFRRDFKVPLYEEIISGDISRPEKCIAKGRRRLVTHTNDHVAFWDDSHVIQNVLPFSVEGARLASEDVEGLVLDGVDTAWSGECDYSLDNGLDIPYFEGVYPFDFLIDQEFSPFATVCLDLSAPDEVIIAELKKFLPKYRKALELKNPSKIADADIAKLRPYRVVEYFDIQIWLAMNKCEITDALLSSILFPDRDDHQTFFAQTVKPFILRVGTREFIDTLSARAASIYSK